MRNRVLPSAAAASLSSAAFTRKHLPQTVLIAAKAKAIQQEERRKLRRSVRARRACSSALARIKFSTRRCSGVCGMGLYSSFETACVGTGKKRPSQASSSDLRIQPFCGLGLGAERAVLGLIMQPSRQARKFRDKDTLSPSNPQCNSRKQTFHFCQSLRGKRGELRRLALHYTAR